MEVRLTTVGDYRFLTNPFDLVVGKSLEVYGEWSHGEIELFGKLVGKRDNVLELGANIGAHTVFIANELCPSGKVYAFEPRRLYFQLLCANVALNGLANVYAYPFAVGERPARLRERAVPTAKITNYGGYALGELPGEGETVEIRTVDSMRDDLERIALLKADIQGYELAMLNGAERLIERDRPHLYVENDQPDKSPALIRKVMAMEYRLWWHFVPMFRKENRARTSFNIFENAYSFNMLCVPVERRAQVTGMVAITDPDHHPKQRSSAS